MTRNAPPHQPQAQTKSEYDYKQHFKTSYQIGVEQGARMQLPASHMDNSLVAPEKPMKAPVKNTFSVFETTTQREFSAKPQTVTETYRKAPAAHKVEGLWMESSLKQNAALVVEDKKLGTAPRGNLRFTTEVRDSFHRQQKPRNVQEIEMNHAEEYSQRYMQFKDTLKQQQVPVSLMFRDRFRTTDQELHDRKKQVDMNLEHKDLQYRDEQPRGRAMMSSMVPRRNESTIPHKEDNADKLRTARVQHLTPVGFKSTTAETYAQPTEQLVNGGDAEVTPKITSQKLLRKLPTRNYGNMETTLHETFQDISPALRDPNRDFAQPQYRRPQTFKKGINGETVIQFDRTRRVEA